MRAGIPPDNLFGAGGPFLNLLIKVEGPWPPYRGDGIVEAVHLPRELTEEENAVGPFTCAWLGR